MASRSSCSKGGHAVALLMKSSMSTPTSAIAEEVSDASDNCEAAALGLVEVDDESKVGRGRVMSAPRRGGLCVTKFRCGILAFMGFSSLLYRFEVKWC